MCCNESFSLTGTAYDFRYYEMSEKITFSDFIKNKNLGFSGVDEEFS